MKVTKDEADRILIDELNRSWADFCRTNVGTTDYRVGDVLTDAIKRATAKLFEDEERKG